MALGSRSNSLANFRERDERAISEGYDPKNRVREIMVIRLLF
jgi:hypothetical protein